MAAAHPMAAGFTVEKAKLSPLEEFLHHRLGVDADEAARIPTLGLDGALGVEGATAELLEMLETAGPYGSGNPEPRFAVAGAQLLRADIVGPGPRALPACGPDGQAAQGHRFPAPPTTPWATRCWRAKSTPSTWPAASASTAAAAPAPSSCTSTTAPPPRRHQTLDFEAPRPLHSAAQGADPFV